MANEKLDQWAVHSYNFGPHDLLRNPKEYSNSQGAVAGPNNLGDVLWENYYGCFLLTELSKHCKKSTNSIFHSQP